jgi:hypothetical protein
MDASINKYENSLNPAQAEVGITVVDGSFEKGARGVTNGTGVYQEATQHQAQIF